MRPPRHGQPVAHAASQAAETLSSRYQRITVVGERQTEGAALEALESYRGGADHGTILEVDALLCTGLPSAMLTTGFRMASSPALTPSRTSISVPRSRATVTLRRRTTPLSSTATCNPSR